MTTTSTLIIATTIITLLACSAFFSGTETAITATSKLRIHRWVKQGRKRARLVEKLQQDKERLISTLLLANNVVNTLASALAASLFITLYGEETGVILATIVMSALIVIFAETMPKTFALRKPSHISMAVAPFLRILIFVLYPFSRLAHAIVTILLYPWRDKLAPSQKTKDEEELLGAIDLHGDTTKNHDERLMLRSVLDLDDVSVGDIMVHRQDMFALDIGQPIDSLIERAITSPYMRIPITKGRADNIIGILYVKHLLKKENQPHNEKDLVRILHKPWFIPESTSLLYQLRAFQLKNEHSAMVIDEYGTLMGIVTLEDILEEIVGDIRDESDTKTTQISQKQKDGSIIVEGHSTVRDINRFMGWDLPDDEAATIGGLITYEARAIPQAQRRMRFYGFEFTILAATKRRIGTVRIKPIPAPPEEDSP
ncbi:MAG: DUF21 domain-containing protein [Alphaproteobacteria bacterium GM7ARS4]|nr:DUF21 domain-containing protein [Alphaproteobacteria bacterium GM7ARS4]